MKVSKATLKKIEDQIQCSRGLIVLTGLIGSGVEDGFNAIVESLAKGPRYFYFLFSHSDWQRLKSPSFDGRYVDLRKGLTYDRHIKRIRHRTQVLLVVDRITDKETMKAVVKWVKDGGIVLTSLRGVDAFSAVEQGLALGVSRRDWFATLSLVVCFKSCRGGVKSCEVIHHWVE